ncbi:hypothetical protein [Saccharothrix sp. ST-888]|uniref:hypothetical protein n=1 Tax=Saccharothrix sp. ST-888 TaxID=1427391 RepID=UPI00061FB4D5|nr:hypothetical protein [Saccharothrix sp. ST-888]KJK57734.1 hypothetical protein UK12_14835 [Saccharothrix sp. ST-888]
MRVLAYELRRLRGLRSTWCVLAAVLLGDAAVAAVIAHQLPSGTLSVSAAVRSLTAIVPLLPLPIAALGAGALGALSYGHEVRHPGLAASQVAYRRRIGLLAGKLAVIGLLAVALAVATIVLDVVVLRFALPLRVDAGQLFAGDVPSLLAAGRALAVFGALVVLAGWSGVLTTSLVRSAAAGMLILCALPALLEPALVLALRQVGRPLPDQVRELLPFQYGLDWLGVTPQGTAPTLGPALSPELQSVLQPVFLAASLAPAAALLVACLVVQARRRAL